MRKLHLIAILLFLYTSCSESNSSSETANPTKVINTRKATSSINTSEIKIFDAITPAESNLNFINQITESPSLNSITHDGMLNGAGVGILDYNNDGLQDVFFASNMESNKLYKNLGDFKFEDVTEAAKLSSKDWSTGVAIVDINNDGYDDIYVCKFMYEDKNKRSNNFYINNGDGTFTCLLYTSPSPRDRG